MSDQNVLLTLLQGVQAEDRERDHTFGPFVLFRTWVVFFLEMQDEGHFVKNSQKHVLPVLDDEIGKRQVEHETLETFFRLEVFKDREVLSVEEGHFELILLGLVVFTDFDLFVAPVLQVAGAEAFLEASFVGVSLLLDDFAVEDLFSEETFGDETVGTDLGFLEVEDEETGVDSVDDVVETGLDRVEDGRLGHLVLVAHVAHDLETLLLQLDQYLERDDLFLF